MSGIEFSAEDWRRFKVAGQVVGGITGTLAVVAAGSAGLLLRQAADARRIIPLAEAPPPRGDGLYGAKFGGKPITMVILGDSSAAGYGVHRPRETPGALLATGVSRRLSRPVRLYRVAVVGAMSAGLPYQVDAALEYEPDVAVILIGGNDVTHVSARDQAVHYLGDAVRRLRETGCKVVVGTCPDIGAIQPIKPPLRWLARKWSRDLAAAQTVAVVAAGGRTVSLVNLLGPIFEADPVRMFSSDHFHPSAEGYARAASVVLPTLLAALGEDDRPAAAVGMSNLEEAAQEAVRSAGTEVSPGKTGGRRVLLRRHPWFGEPRAWFGHKAALTADGATAGDAGNLGSSGDGAVGWTPADHQAAGS
ncbi:SGNH/GDSL hydrolase family protein [Paractinoplanes globisporus]|uniref:SGNH/GDSL hydrolase family protein n=1 Tax=Paractinoplanes globisporus TaxID=113565 RepID=A0ABW6WDR2_9ACTN|nr:SGNH/GDSL hydrolase family protein [Actinoplanes globisporus]